jgi:hypothetical protein
LYRKQKRADARTRRLEAIATAGAERGLTLVKRRICIYVELAYDVTIWSIDQRIEN